MVKRCFRNPVATFQFQDYHDVRQALLLKESDLDTWNVPSTLVQEYKRPSGKLFELRPIILQHAPSVRVRCYFSKQM